MRQLYLFLYFLFVGGNAAAQQDSVAIPVLQDVTVTAYGDKQLSQTPAAINVISSQQLSRFGNVNVLQALNTTPGVRMDERSPGSYRLNIRGSSVRSPYGVRNVKVYYDGIPVTDPGGGTPFNLFGFYNFGSLEVLKGPGASMYGAGTGGVVLINPQPVTDTLSASVGVVYGSYGLKGLHAGFNAGKNNVTYEHLESAGYRQQSRMRRDVASWHARVQQHNRNTLTAHFLYSDLYYQTPGALTLNEYNVNPRASRPGFAVYPGAAAAMASIRQRVALIGFTDRYTVAPHFTNTTSLYGIYSQTHNPTIQNYERKSEPHLGLRTVFNYDLNVGASIFNLEAGAELQQEWATSRGYKNKSGLPDTLMTDDEAQLRQYFGFVQASWQYRHWAVTAAASVNNTQFYFNRFSTHPFISEQKNYNVQLSPRLAVLYRVSKYVSAYINVARGFSPPSRDEVFADNNTYNLALQPEHSWNYEPGIRGTALQHRLWFDASIFKTGLQNTIVTRRDAAGGNYYVNAGKTDQQGLEAVVGYNLFPASSWLQGSRVWTSYSHYNFRYRDFIQSGDDFSGNKMPGVASDNLTLAADLVTQTGVYLNVTWSYTGKIALNDANTAFANAYHLVSAKLGYNLHLHPHFTVSVYTGADNLLDEKYSLGNDINGFGGRYYNAAAGRSYYAGINMQI